MIKPRKSQLELFGLAIVVVIVIIATLFLLVYFGNKKPSEARKSFVESELASRMLNTLINIDFEDTTNNCAKIKMAEIIRFCGSGQASSYTCNSENACEVAQGTIRIIFAGTIDLWTASQGVKKNYYFLVYTSDPEKPALKLGDKCQGDKKFKEYIIPTNIHVNLEICS